MLLEGIDAEHNPDITFTSANVQPTGDDGLTITGDLSIRGVTRSVVLDATYNGQGQTPFVATVISFSATTRINRKQFNITFDVPLEGGGVLVGDEIKSLEIEAIKSDRQ